MRNRVILVALLAIHSAAMADGSPLPSVADVLKIEQSLWYADMSAIIADDGATDPDFSGIPRAIRNLRCRAKGLGRALCKYSVIVAHKRGQLSAKRLLIHRGGGEWIRAPEGK